MINTSLLLIVGLLLSAFFSGTETGFYRVSRIRLLLDGLSGEWTARGLLWLTNNPTLFVATTLVGNNVANYFVSRGIVLTTKNVILGNSFIPHLVAIIIFSPLVFVYGELLPKNLFYHVPNRLLRLGAPMFFIFGLILSPLVLVLWVFGRILQYLIGESPERIRLMLARKELARVLEEGHQVGILKPSQHDLAQRLFADAGQPVVQFTTPASRVIAVQKTATKSEVIRLARRHRAAAIPIESQDQPRRLIGYVRIVDLHLQQEKNIAKVRPLIAIDKSKTLIDALMTMRSRRETLAQVVDDDGQMLGLLNTRGLIESVFRGE